MFIYKYFLSVLCVIILVINCCELQAKQDFYMSDSLAIPQDRIYIVEDNTFLEKYNTVRYLGVSTSIFLMGAVLAALTLYLLPESISNWEKTSFHEDISNLGSKWWANVSEPPVWDNDALWLNYITHPYWGSVYYLQARYAGLKPMESFGYSVLLSTVFWEYGIEAVAENPSIQDLIITPVLGSLLGEFFYQTSLSIINNNETLYNSRALGITVLTLMNPFYPIMEKTPIHNFVVNKNSVKQATENKMTYSSGWQPNYSGINYVISISTN